MKALFFVYIFLYVLGAILFIAYLIKLSSEKKQNDVFLKQLRNPFWAFVNFVSSIYAFPNMAIYFLRACIKGVLLMFSFLFLLLVQWVKQRT